MLEVSNHQPDREHNRQHKRSDLPRYTQSQLTLPGAQGEHNVGVPISRCLQEIALKLRVRPCCGGSTVDNLNVRLELARAFRRS
jgi:hypothetical protein